jgi:hypothetical protein
MFRLLFRSLLFILPFSLIFILITEKIYAQDVLTQHNDAFRTGAILSETNLNTSNVNTSTFGKIYTRIVDGEIFAQPLYVHGLTVPIKGGHTNVLNVVLVATMKNNIYAFNADDTSPDPTAGVLWGPVNLGKPEKGRVDFDGVAPPNPTCPSAAYYGVASTPVIDLANNTMWIVAKTIDAQGAPHQMLYSIDIRTGLQNEANATHAPVEILSSADTGIIAQQLSRAGMLLSRGKVYLAFAGHCDFPVDENKTARGSYHGWVFAYDTANLTKVGEFNTTPNGIRGGVWQSGNGIAADLHGNIYFQTGNESNLGENGLPPRSQLDRSESIIRTDQTLDNPVLFPPAGQPAPPYLDYAHLDSQDLDLTSSGPLLIPGPSDPDLITGGKPGRLFLLDRASMGLKQTFKAAINNSNPDLTPEQCTYGPDHYDPTSTVVNTLCPHIHSGLVFWQTSDPKIANIYVWAERDYLRRYLFNTETRLIVNAAGQALPLAPALNLDGPTYSIQGATLNPLNDPNDHSRVMPGGTLSLSAHGSTAGSAIIWATHPVRDNAEYKNVYGELEAYDAANLHALWTSGTDQFGLDFLGKHAKYAPVTVADGRVYAPTNSNRLVVYGLRASQAFTAPWQEPADIGEALAGSDSTVPAGAQVSAVSRSPGLVDLYLVDKKGVRNAGYIVPGGQYFWGYEIPHGAAQPSTVPGAPISVTARNPNAVDLFSVMADGSIWNVGFWDAGVAGPGPFGWSLGYPIPGAAAGFAQSGTPVATLNRTPDLADLFVVRADGSVWNAGHWAAGVSGPGPFGWNAGYQIPGAGPGFAKPGTAVAVLSRTPNVVDLYVTRADGSIWNAGNWINGVDGPGAFGWSPGYPIVGAGAGYTPAGATVTAICRGPNLVDLFVVRADGSVWNAAHWSLPPPGSSVSGWNPGYAIAGAGAGFAAPGSRVTALQRDANHTDLYLTKPDGTIWNAGWWSNTVNGAGAFGWNPGYRVGPSLVVDPSASVTGLARGAGHVDLFVTAKDGQILSPWWDASVR